MRVGVCYYPEQWPRARWRLDAAMMADAGLELVRIGEFAWSAYEPQRGRFAWGWLDEAVETLAAAGLQVVLGTPTATPPVWLARERPDILAVTADGRPRPYGTRRHTCPTSPAYREEARRITTALVDRYGIHAAVVAWQLDNEPGNHDTARCWCEACESAFTQWLTERYGDVDALNDAWGTAFWSQTYPDLASVRLPRPAPTDHSPSLLLAHRRFSAAQTASGLQEQRDIVRAGSPSRETIVNHYLGDLHVDPRAIARADGVGAVDSYPHGTSGPVEVGYVLDLARGLAGRGWVMEQQPGPINWTPHNPLVAPGQVLAWGLQAALHGMSALLFFRWRAARGGQEQYHSGLLRHDGTPDRGLAEAAQLVAALRDLDPELRRPQARIALLHRYVDAWAIEIDPHLQGLTHRDLLLPAYAAARSLGLDVDVVAPDDDLAHYDVVLAPALHLADEVARSALHGALDRGATVVLGPRALTKDAENRWIDEAAPAGLVERLGARVGASGTNEPWPVGTPTAEVAGAGAGVWVEVYEPAGAEVLARYSGGPADGQAAIVQRDGLWAVGCTAEPAWRGVLQRITGAAPGPGGREVFTRGDRLITLQHDLDGLGDLTIA